MFRVNGVPLERTFRHYQTRDSIQVQAELAALRKQVMRLVDSSLDIARDLRMLQQSLPVQGSQE